MTTITLTNENGETCRMTPGDQLWAEDMQVGVEWTGTGWRGIASAGVRTWRCDDVHAPCDRDLADADAGEAWLELHPEMR